MVQMGKRIREYYISIDVEADGPCPGVNSMLQFGAVFYDFNGKVVREFTANLLELEGAVSDPNTMKWWAEQEVKNPGIWARMREGAVHPRLAMEQFRSAVDQTSKELDASPVCVAYPAGYDFTYIYYYLCLFFGVSCVGFSCLDLKTLGMALIQDTYHNSAKKRYPARWFNPKLKHTHDGLQDARGQGFMFQGMLRDLKRNWVALNATESILQGELPVVPKKKEPTHGDPKLPVSGIPATSN
jgi:hypothetical protein